LNKQMKIVYVFSLFILMLNLSRFANFVAASNIIYYVEPGDSIQTAINRANPGDILLIKRGVYKEYPIFVNKSLTIIGESREETIIDGEELADLIINIMADNVKISNLTIQNTGGGAYPPAQKGIQITAVKNVEISDCIIKNCATNLRLGGSSFSRILRNMITHALTNGYGVHLDENSKYNEITSNYISFNDVGIQVERTATNNTIYHNNFMNNFLDVGGPASGANNRWHNGYPSGGNYWDKNSGEDLKSGVQQIEDGSDGICDKSYNNDQYPLMGPIYSFKAGKWGNQEYYVSISTDSEISNFKFNESLAYLQFAVNKKSQKGFSRVIIPKSLLWVEEDQLWKIYLNETLCGETNIRENSECTFIYLTYTQGFWIVKMVGTNAVPEMYMPISLIFILIVISAVLFVLKKLKH